MLKLKLVLFLLVFILEAVKLFDVLDQFLHFRLLAAADGFLVLDLLFLLLPFFLDLEALLLHGFQLSGLRCIGCFQFAERLISAGILRKNLFLFLLKPLDIPHQNVNLVFHVIDGQLFPGNRFLPGRQFLADFHQTALDIRRLLFHGFLIKVAAGILCIHFFQLFPDVTDRLVQLLNGAFRFLTSGFIAVHIRLAGSHFFLFPGHLDFLLMHRIGNLCQTVFERVLFLLSCFQLFPNSVIVRLKGFHVCGQLVDFTLSSQQAGRLGLNGTARHGTAGMHDVSMQRHQAERMSALPHDGNAVIQIIRDHGSAQKIFHNGLVIAIAGDQIGGHAETSRHGEHPLFIPVQVLSPDRASGQECSASELVVSQIIDQLFRCLFIIRHNVLDRSAQRHVNGRLILFRNADQLPENAPDARNRHFPGILHGPLDRLLIPVHFLLHFREQMIAGFRRLKLSGNLIHLAVAG